MPAAPRYRRVEGAIRRDVGGERLLLDPRTDRLLVLNESAALVWDELAGHRSTDDLARALASAFDVPEGTDLAGDVGLLLHELLAAGLVEVTG